MQKTDPAAYKWTETYFSAFWRLWHPRSSLKRRMSSLWAPLKDHHPIHKGFSTMPSLLTKGLISKCHHIGNGVPAHELERHQWSVRHRNDWPWELKVSPSQSCSTLCSQSGSVLIFICSNNGSYVTPLFVPSMCLVVNSKREGIAVLLTVLFLALSR